MGAAEGHQTPLEPLILASASPRRQALLPQLRLGFRVVVPAVEETPLTGEAPASLARRLATGKARAVARTDPERHIVGADTVVSLGHEVLGKPADADDAVRMLRLLRDGPHRVTTGVCVIAPGGALFAAYRRTQVQMRRYTDAEIDAYVATGDPMDKAGAYAVQHPRFRPVAWFAGCYTTVVGLPLCLVHDLLSAAGLTPHSAADVDPHADPP